MLEKGNLMATSNPDSGIVIPHPTKWHQWLAAALLTLFIRFLAATIRFRIDDRSGHFQGKSSGKIIIAFWHNRLALCGILYQRYIIKFFPERRIAGLVSASRDGGLLAQILANFGIVPIRGSSSRRGGQALIEMTTCAERGYDLGLTPDGPRGPRYEVQDGAIVTSQLTGLPIVPMTYRLSWKIRINSWDGFLIPLPFARCDIITEKPLAVPREISDEQREAYRKQLEETLKNITLD
jgi:lysophospholipid acyltransferase (LPLAT)-like uncharacterized protein